MDSRARTTTGLCSAWPRHWVIELEKGVEQPDGDINPKPLAVQRGTSGLVCQCRTRRTARNTTQHSCCRLCNDCGLLTRQQQLSQHKMCGYCGRIRIAIKPGPTPPCSSCQWLWRVTHNNTSQRMAVLRDSYPLDVVTLEQIQTQEQATSQQLPPFHIDPTQPPGDGTLALGPIK